MSDAPLARAAAEVKEARKKRARAAGVEVPPEPPKPPKTPKAPKAPKESKAPKTPKEPRQNYLRTLTKEDIELRKNAKIEEIKAKTDQRIRYADIRENQRQLGVIEKARLKRLNPTAFASENKAVFDMTGQVAQDTPEELDKKQRKETIKALGNLSYSAEPKNFVDRKSVV